MSHSLGPLGSGSELAATIDAYRTCELATIGKDGTVMAWPTSGLSRPDGTFLLTTSLEYPQKASNVRRDGRVALLFSDPTASGLERPEQILVQGRATCPDEVHVAPEGDLAEFWARLFERQPACRKYLDWLPTALTDFSFMRLPIRVTPGEITLRNLPAPAAPQARKPRAARRQLTRWERKPRAARRPTTRRARKPRAPAVTTTRWERKPRAARLSEEATSSTAATTQWERSHEQPGGLRLGGRGSRERPGGPTTRWALVWGPGGTRGTRAAALPACRPRGR
jgi:hypothetical protein